MKFRDSYHIWAMMTIVGWSASHVLTRIALRYISASSLGCLRYVVASVALLAIVLILRIKPPKVKDLPWFLLSGGSGFFLYMIAFNIGCQTVTAATSAVIIASVPVITALLASFIYKERLTAIQWAAIAISFGGVVVLTVLTGGFSVNIGLLWLIVAAVLLSIYNLLQRKLTRQYSALQTTSFSVFAGTIMLCIFLPGAIGEAAEAPPTLFVCVAVLGVFSSAVAYVTWSKAMSKAEKTSSVSNYMFVTPFLVAILGIILADEMVETSTIVGGLIIIFGQLVFNFGGGILSRRRGNRADRA